jgi:hypothetical protein
MMLPTDSSSPLRITKNLEKITGLDNRIISIKKKKRKKKRKRIMEQQLAKKAKLTEEVQNTEKALVRTKRELDLLQQEIEEQQRFEKYVQQQFTHENLSDFLLGSKRVVVNRFTKASYKLSEYIPGSITLFKDYCSCDPYVSCGHGPQKQKNVKFDTSLVKDLMKNVPYKFELEPKETGYVNVIIKFEEGSCFNTSGLFPNLKKIFETYRPQGYKIIEEFQFVLSPVHFFYNN